MPRWSVAARLRSDISSPARKTRPACGGTHAGERLDDVGGARAELAGEADDLAGTDGETHRLAEAVGDEALDAEERRVAERAAGREHGLEVAAEHHGDDRVDVELRGRLRREAAAVAKNGDAVGDAKDFGQAVGDVDDAPPLAGEALDDGEHALDLAVGERRGRLVEDQDAGIADEEARDLEELLLGDAESRSTAVRGSTWSRPTVESSLRARALRLPGHQNAGTPAWPRTRFSATVMVGTDEYSWWTTATPAACERARGEEVGLVGRRPRSCRNRAGPGRTAP